MGSQVITKHLPEVMCFFRDGMFYPVLSSGTKPLVEEAADHAALNPGTLRIEDIRGNVLWPEGSKQ